MKLVVCLDDNNGMMFNGRRQSQDRNLRERLISRIGDKLLLMNQYTNNQFANLKGNFKVCENFISVAKDDDYCFIENLDVTDWLNEATEIIVYKWNRVYPADLNFPFESIKQRWNLIECYEFAGFSHEKITEEVYRR